MIVEDGTGVESADSYGSEAGLDDYLDRTGQTMTGDAETALVRATAYIDATWGAFFIGHRAGYDQGLEWPRIGGLDADGEPTALLDSLGRDLPALPKQLQEATYELAIRAAAGPLAADVARLGMVKRERRKLGAMEKEVEYVDGAAAQTAYGIVLGILAPILNGSQPGAASPTWFWL